MTVNHVEGHALDSRSELWQRFEVSQPFRSGGGHVSTASLRVLCVLCVVIRGSELRREGIGDRIDQGLVTL